MNGQTSAANRGTLQAPSQEKPRQPRFSPAKTAAYLVLVALAVFSLVPFGWVVLAAFDPNATIYFKVPKE